MEWLLFAFALELGAIRGNDIPVDVSSYVQTEATAIMFEHLEIGGTLRSYQVPGDEYTWIPFRIDYTTTLTVRFGVFSFGFEHECFHNVVSDDPLPKHRIKDLPSWATEKVFIRVTTP